MNSHQRKAKKVARRRAYVKHQGRAERSKRVALAHEADNLTDTQLGIQQAVNWARAKHMVDTGIELTPVPQANHEV